MRKVGAFCGSSSAAELVWHETESDRHPIIAGLYIVPEPTSKRARVWGVENKKQKKKEGKRRWDAACSAKKEVVRVGWDCGFGEASCVCFSFVQLLQYNREEKRIEQSEDADDGQRQCKGENMR